jgi:AcrR family transcriptional regulator
MIGPVTVDARAGTRRRPPDRRAHILAAAARRFWTEGYHQVSMADIAADVGIGASALYRHFRGKQELLLTVLDVQLTRMEELTGQQPDAVAALATVSLEHREFGVLWEREAGHLPAETRRGLRHRLRGLAARVAAGIPDAATADLRSWAILSVLDSPSHHHTELDRARFAAVLGAAAHAVATAELPADDSVLPAVTASGLRPASRREALLAVASRLFAHRGYPSVGLDDIGAAAGIAGPSVYNHFASKADVLAAALSRGNETLWLGVHRCLARADTPSDALRRLVTHYTEFTADDPDAVGVLVGEVIHLPDDRREEYRRAQRDYVAEWVALLRQSRPDLDEATARVRTHAALSLINSLSRIPHLRGRPGHVGHTAALARAVLNH